MTDQGIGIPEDVQEAIVQPLGRASNAAARRIQGLGLGLYLSQQIVAGHAGRIWAESPGEGQGTRMHVWLPADGSE